MQRIKFLSVFRITLALFSGLMLNNRSFAEDKPLTLNDFAFGSQFEVSPGAAMYSVELPEWVYSGVTRSDLGDMRVFNGKSEIVPHELSTQYARSEVMRVSLSLPMYAIEGSSSPRSASSEIQISQDASGNLVKVKVAGKKDSRAERSYLVDLRKLEQSIAALTVEWGGEDTNKILPLAISASNDLKKWTPLLVQGAIAKLAFQGAVIEEKTVQFPAQHSKYLRIDLPDDTSIKLTRVIGDFLTTKRVAPSLKTLKVSGKTEDSRTIYYDTEGVFPVRSLQLEIGENNSVIQGEVSSRADERSAWINRGAASFYEVNLKEGAFKNNPLQLAAVVTDRFWKFSLRGRDSHVGSSPPRLVLNWIPDQIRILARGEPPFTLAYGSARARPADFGGQAIPVVASLSDEAGLNSKLLPAARLAGEAAKRLPPAPIEISWRKLLLWGFLALFVFVVGGMALSLGKDLTKTN